MWSSAAHGERLRHLTQSTTPEVLGRNLAEYGLDGSSRGAFYQSLLERNQAQLRLLQRLAPEGISDVFRVIAVEPWYENGKTALHASVSQGEQRAEFAKIMLKTRDIPAIDFNADRWPLPPGLSLHEFRRAKESLRADGDFLGADTVFDQAYYRSLSKAVAGTPAEFREAMGELLSLNIDILNAGSLLRNLRTYHLPAARMSELWLDGGFLLPREHLTELCGKADFEAAAKALPRCFRRAFEEAGDVRLWEGRLWNGLHHRARNYFMDFSHPLYSLAAYPVLLHFETQNLGRVFEGVHFAIPAEEMMKMMTGE
jgi:vacuolar-type H+-ATPase subunit C/Vma6